MLCAGLLGAQIAAIFLPQTVFWPFAAFFVCLSLAAGIFCRPARGGAIVLLAGAVMGLALLARTQNELEKLHQCYAGRLVQLSACVEQVDSAYGYGRVSALLRVEQAEGEPVEFRCQCADLPACSVGERIEAAFLLEVPTRADQLDFYADGLAFSAEYEGGFVVTGQDDSFRTRAYQWQQALSGAVRRFLDEDTGGVLAAMVVGDRNHLSSELNASYRAAGLSHVLVVSGMHATILCGGLFAGRASAARPRKLWRSRVRSVASAGMALLLVGITGFTPSVVRAGVSIWISALGVWLFAPADALTSLAIAGLWITLPNSYAACDVGFELSFAAVLGTLAGAEVSRRGRAAWLKRQARRKNRPNPSPLRQWRGRIAGAVWDSACISACASAATFPVLVLRGMSTSLYALVSSVAVLWMVQPILLLGIGAALTGLLPFLRLAQMAFSFGAGLLVWLLNGWARWVETWPGAQIYFETGYAAFLCLLLIGLCLLASRWRVRLRVALPVVLLAAAVGILAGNALERDVIKITLVGGSTAPSVVLSQNGQAVVLYRGGTSGQAAVENRLARDGVEEIALVVDLRLSPETPCPLEGEESLAVAEMADYQTRKYRCGGVGVEVFRTHSGCGVRLTAGGRSLAAVSGEFELAQPVQAEILLASPSAPDAFIWDEVLTLREDYAWMTGGGQVWLDRTLSLRPGGGWRLS